MGFFITSVHDINKGKSKAQDMIARYSMYGDENPVMKLSREILEAQVYEDGFFYTENVGGYDIHFTISSQDCISVNDIDYDETAKKSAAGVAQIRHAGGEAAGHLEKLVKHRKRALKHGVFVFIPVFAVFILFPLSVLK